MVHYVVIKNEKLNIFGTGGQRVNIHFSFRLEQDVQDGKVERKPDISAISVGQFN